MSLLIVGSAFFSSGEAAYFYLNRADRQRLASRGRLGRAAVDLLSNPENLLTAILFWNLVINIAYFALVSVVGLRLERSGHAGLASGVSIAALMVLIICSEMMPKSLAVLNAPTIARWWSLPMTSAVWLVAPILPSLLVANSLSRRVLWPSFREEENLRAGDLQTALALSTADAALLEQEQRVMAGIVHLSEIRAVELMRPRTGIESFAPPVHLEELKQAAPPSGFLLIHEPETEEIIAGAPLKTLTSVPKTHLERLATPALYVPWCMTVADALEIMRQRRQSFSVVVNEYGETIGILTLDDILDTIFGRSPSRVKRLLDREPIEKNTNGEWIVTGMTTLNRMERFFGAEGPPRKSSTVAGVLQEELERLPQPDDTCQWGPFQLQVIEEAEGYLLIRVDLLPTKDDTNGSPPD